MAGPKSIKAARERIARAARQMKAAGACRQARHHLPALLILTDDAVPMDMHALAMSLPRGAGIVIRSSDADRRQALTREAIAAARPRGVKVLVAADWRLAMRVKADGVHLPESMRTKGPGLRRLKPALLLTAAAHGRRAIRKAKAQGLDAVLVSPVFPTQSHPYTTHLGARGLAAIVAHSTVPVFALGGIGHENAHALKGTGAVGLALIRGWE